MKRRWVGIFLAALLWTADGAGEAWAASAREIDADVQATLGKFYKEVKDGSKLVRDATGVLVFPNIFKAGIAFGGEYGEGALLINGRTVDYYNATAASFGFQLGVQKKSIVILFMRPNALRRFQTSEGWKAGVDASVAVVTVGAGGSVDVTKLNEPILAFIFDQKGLMYNLTLEGSKFTKIKR